MRPRFREADFSGLGYDHSAIAYLAVLTPAPTDDGRDSDEAGRLVCEMELNGLHLDVSIHLGFKSDSHYTELLIGIFCLLQ